MRKRLLGSGLLICFAFLCGLTACSKSESHPQVVGVNSGHPDSGTPPADMDSGHPDSGHPDSGMSSTDAGCKASATGAVYTLIDDMETTPHGPIVLKGINLPLSPGYWYNSGANYLEDGGVTIDTSNPPQGSFVFNVLPNPHPTLDCKASAHAAHQSCALNGLYDTCGVGFEFAQQPDGDAGAVPPAADAGDGGASIPMVTVPFDISRYKAITFWGMTGTPDPTTGSMQVKVQLPDPDTDPRGEVCNGGGRNISKCYNSYGAVLKFTKSWQQFTVLLDAGTDGVPPDGGIAIDPSWGNQQAKWLPTQVYGINWQAQRNTEPDAGPPLTTDIWIDDVYFIQ